MRFRNGDEAFVHAIDHGHLSADVKSNLFADKFMYMYSTENFDYFKNVKTREYLKAANDSGGLA